LHSNDDLFLAVGDGVSGNLFADNFGTIIDVNDAVVVGQGGTALAQISGGARLFADDSVIGQSASSDGRIVVTGNTSLWQQTNSLTIGEAGRGDVQVLAQGRMENENIVMASSATSVGLALINGTGSVWDTAGFMNVGVAGTATLRIFDGGRAALSGAARLATAADGEGHVEVNGLSSLWTVGTTVTVGEVGLGTVTVLNGGRVTSTNVVVGDNVGSRGDVTVSGAGSLWEITGTLDVSQPGEAVLTIGAGGRVATTGVTRIAAAGELVMAGGRLDVVAAAGVTNNGLILGRGRIAGAVANAGPGEIRTHAGDQLVLGATVSNAGLIALEGGELEVLGTTSNTGDIDVHNATLRFSGGLTNASGGQMAATGGDVDVFGAVTNNAGGQIVVGAEATAVFHDAVTNNGQLFVMPAANVLMLENLSFGSVSSLNVQLAGVEPASDLPQVEVGGLAALGGALNVTLASGFEPQLGDSFQVLTAAGGRSGFFLTEALPALSIGLAWDVEYASNSLVLSVVPGLTADFDLDNDVDSGDLAAWRGGFGASSGAGHGDGDANADGDVDGADFLAWQQQFGSSLNSAAAGAGVPEPASWASLAAAFAAILWRSRTSERNR
jgi:T5SS/PEP-CTERM-associated repeat protein